MLGAVFAVHFDDDVGHVAVFRVDELGAFGAFGHVGLHLDDLYRCVPREMVWWG